MSLQRIGVFLSSKSGLPESYRQAAEAVGAWIGRTGRTLVYGGSRSGLMETLAQACSAAGGNVIGVVPQIVRDRDLVSDACRTVFYTADLHDRKSAMMRESDIFIALPGGIGTLDELFTVLAAATIGTSRQRVVLYNVDGCWDALVTLIADLRRRGLVDDGIDGRLAYADSIGQLEGLCG